MNNEKVDKILSEQQLHVYSDGMTTIYNLRINMNASRKLAVHPLQ